MKTGHDGLSDANTWTLAKRQLRGGVVTPQERMHIAVENYFRQAEVLSADLVAILGAASDSQSWIRTYIRAVAAMIDGDSYCFQQMAAISLEMDSPLLSRNEVNALTAESGNSATAQIKYVLRAAYKMFELDQPPDFGGNGWVQAKRFTNKRHKLTHPKVPSDLHIAENEWTELYEGSRWLVKEHLALVKRMHRKHHVPDGTQFP